MKGRYTTRAMLFMICSLLPLCTQAGRHMAKLSDKKQCADADCSRCSVGPEPIPEFIGHGQTCILDGAAVHHSRIEVVALRDHSLVLQQRRMPSIVMDWHPVQDPILIARALQDYYPQDCRFIPIHQGQLVYVYYMLKDRGNLFWAGSVQGSYYGDQEARIGHFPSSIVEEIHALMPAEVEVKTDKWDFHCP